MPQYIQSTARTATVVSSSSNCSSSSSSSCKGRRWRQTPPDRVKHLLSSRVNGHRILILLLLMMIRVRVMVMVMVMVMMMVIVMDDDGMVW